jgi:hypothetical protein
MPTFRKKPVEVEAVHFDGTKESANQALAWIGSHGAEAARVNRIRPEDGIYVGAPAYAMVAAPGDWIIRGTQGEFYPCKPDTFEAAYEPVEASR